ncbi:MAG: hypothetical protein ACK4YP_16955 [Myxococcota bacterium]
MLGPDFDGDGTADLVVAQAGYAIPASAGACDGPGVYVIPGGTRGDARVPVTDVATFRLDRDHCFGAALATAPDLDGDGIAELLVTEPSSYGHDYEADVYMVTSRAVAAGGTTSDVATTFVDARVVARQGDLDGDGVDDLVLASDTAWWAVSGATIPMGTVEAPTERVPAAESQGYGSTGDLDGDGLAEVATVSGAGAIAVVSPADGTDAWVEITGAAFGPPRGFDVDGDGYRDVVAEAGAVYVVPVYARGGNIPASEATTILAPVGTQPTIVDMAVTDEGLVVSARTAADAESVQAVIAWEDLGPGSVDLSVARGCVRTDGFLGPHTVAGSYLGNGTLQVALGAADLGGYVLDLAAATEACD